MDIIKRAELAQNVCLGRTIWRAVGINAPLEDEISVGFTRFSLKDGAMKAHKHEREVIYVIDACGASARFGSDPTQLGNSTQLRNGDLLRFPEGEWHIFDLQDENAYLDILWVFSVPQNHTTDAD